MIRIIPAIDIISGKCVRLTQGEYSSVRIYSDDPVDMARRFRDKGIRKLHIVDLDGARTSSPQNLGILERIVSATGMETEWGGGIKDRASLDSVLDCGASQAICGSIAVTRSEEFISWIEDHGPEKIILGADIRDGKVATHGWTEDSGSDAHGLIRKFIPHGLSQVICTDISRDGMLQGPSFGLYESLRRSFPGMAITASGGIASMDDIMRLDSLGIDNAIAGKAIYEGLISLEEIAEYNQKSL